MIAEEDTDESPHVNTDETDEEGQNACPAFDNDLDSEVDNFTIEEDDRIFMVMVHPVNPHHFVHALSMVSRHLAEVFAKNSKLKGFEDIVPTSLHTYADVFTHLCQWLYTPMLMSSVKQPLTPFQSTTNETTLLSWSASPHLDSAKSTRDIRWGYNNVCIHEGDKWKATFHTNRGLFELLVMYFGLTNSLAMSQTMMNGILQDLITEGVVSMHLNDILIFTNLLGEHHWTTCLVLDRMCEHKLYLWPEKCEFEKTKIEYLGIIISHNKVEMDPVKIAGVADWPTPSNKKEVQSFIGFVNFY
jgi:hypothetical protein